MRPDSQSLGSLYFFSRLATITETTSLSKSRSCKPRHRNILLSPGSSLSTTTKTLPRLNKIRSSPGGHPTARSMLVPILHQEAHRWEYTIQGRERLVDARSTTPWLPHIPTTATGTMSLKLRGTHHGQPTRCDNTGSILRATNTFPRAVQRLMGMDIMAISTSPSPT